MGPETSSVTFGIGGLLIYLLFAALTATGVVATVGIIAYAYAKLPALKTAVEAIIRVTRFDIPKGDEKQRVEALKARLASLEKVNWFIFTMLGAAYVATSPGISSVKIPTLEVPIGQFGAIFYAIFLGTVLFYLKIVSSLQTIVASADNKKELQFQISTNSGILSPFSESTTFLGRTLDVLGFCALIIAWWVAFEIGSRLYVDHATARLAQYLPWMAVALGLFALISLRRAMATFATSRTLYFAKLVCAVLSLAGAWLVVKVQLL